MFLIEQPPKLTGLNLTYDNVMHMPIRKARFVAEQLRSTREAEIAAYKKAGRKK